MRLRKYTGKLGASWIIDYKERDGKRRRVVLKDIRSEKGAKLAFADFQLKFERQEIGLPTEENITIRSAFDLLREDRKLSGSTEGWIERIDYISRNICRFFGDALLFKSLSEDEIARYRVHRVNGGAKASTVNKELKLIISAGRVAMKSGKIGRLPWNRVTLAIDRSGREVWSYIKDHDAEKLLSLLKHGGKVTLNRSNGRPMPFDFKPRPMLWAKITFMLNTGARVGEMFKVQWGDIDTDNKTVRLISTKSARSGKPAQPRYIPMSPALEELFKVLPRGNEKECVFELDENINRDFDHALKHAGLPHYRIHDLRHSFASALAREGVALYTISALMGHATVQMTQRYAHLNPENLASAVGKLKFRTGASKAN